MFPFKFEISNFEIYINSFTLEFNLPKYLASVFDLNFDPFHWLQYCYTISNFNQHKLERNDCRWHFWTFSGSVREVIVIFLLSTVKILPSIFRRACSADSLFLGIPCRSPRMSSLKALLPLSVSMCFTTMFGSLAFCKNVQSFTSWKQN